MKFLITIVVFAGAGCAPLSDPPLSGDTYRIAAESWLGADIQEMLAASPNPNRKCGTNEEGVAGCARWDHSRYSRGGPSGPGATEYSCVTVAHYNSDGTITEVNVQDSRRCELRYGEQMASMTRSEFSPVD
jgi:hypothetical protein